jgi:hypothetical protein
MHAEELWGRQSLYGVAWKGNTGYGSAASPGSIYCDVWTTAACNASNPRRPAIGLWPHFALLYGFLGNSSALSPFGLSPSDRSGYFYAISWSLVRYAIDQYATTESSFLTGLTQSTASGVTNLRARAGGVTVAELLGRWALALYADDHTGSGTNPDVQIPTWDMPHIYDGLKADFPEMYSRQTPVSTTPLSFGTIAPTNYTGMVGGGVDYFELSGVHGAAQVLSIESTAGGAPPWTLRIAIVRVQ